MLSQLRRQGLGTLVLSQLQRPQLLLVLLPADCAFKGRLLVCLLSVFVIAQAYLHAALYDRQACSMIGKPVAAPGPAATEFLVFLSETHSPLSDQHSILYINCYNMIQN